MFCSNVVGDLPLANFCLDCVYVSVASTPSTATVECCQHGRKKSSHTVLKSLKKSHFMHCDTLVKNPEISPILKNSIQLYETWFGDFSTV